MSPSLPLALCLRVTVSLSRPLLSHSLARTTSQALALALAQIALLSMSLPLLPLPLDLS